MTELDEGLMRIEYRSFIIILPVARKKEITIKVMQNMFNSIEQYYSDLGE